MGLIRLEDLEPSTISKKQEDFKDFTAEVKATIQSLLDKSIAMKPLNTEAKANRMIERVSKALGFSVKGSSTAAPSNQPTKGPDDVPSDADLKKMELTDLQGLLREIKGTFRLGPQVNDKGWLITTLKALRSSGDEQEEESPIDEEALEEQFNNKRQAALLTVPATRKTSNKTRR